MAAKFDYDEMTAVASELIEFFGMPAVLRRETDSPTDRPCTVAIIDFKPRERPADLANPIDRTVYLAVDNPGIVAKPPDNEQDQLITFVQPMTNPPVIKEILPLTCKPKELAPAGQTVFWEFTVRR